MSCRWCSNCTFIWMRALRGPWGTWQCRLCGAVFKLFATLLLHYDVAHPGYIPRKGKG